MSRLLFLHQGAIGDFILSLSVLQALRESLHCSHVDVIASSPVARIAAGVSAVDRCFSPEPMQLYQLFAKRPVISPMLAELLQSADTVLSFLGNPAEPVSQNLLAYCGNGKRTLCLDPRPTPATIQIAGHIAEQWARDIRLTGLPLAVLTPPRIAWPGSTDQGPAIAIHPGSGGRGKCWPLERFVDLTQRLKGRRIRWLLGPAELERGAFDEVLSSRHKENGDEIIREPPWNSLVDILVSCSLYLGNDSGISHLAAALGVPTVVIFGTTDPRIWRPLGQHVTVVSPTPPGYDMESITVQQVLATVNRS